MDNLICAKCKEKIEEADLVECPHCWEMYHRECWENTPNCLSCKKFNIEFARSRVDDAVENEEKENQYKAVSEEAEIDETFEDFPLGKEPRNSNIAHTIMSISNAVFIISIVMGVLFAIYMAIVTMNNIIGLIIGVVAGGLVVASGWVASILISGFAELVNNSQKNAHYLSRLVEKQEEKEE